MVEEIYIKFGCERCPQWTTLETKAGVLGIVRKKPYPDNWGKVNDVHLCPDCNVAYEKLFSEFLQSGKTKKVDEV